MRKLLGIPLLPVVLCCVNCVHQQPVAVPVSYRPAPLALPPLPPPEILEPAPEMNAPNYVPGPRIVVTLPDYRAPAKRVRVVRSEPDKTEKQGKVEPAPAPTVRIPELGPVMSVQERLESQQQLEEILARTLRILKAVDRQTLNGTQLTVKSRVESFLQQAQSISRTDLRAARNMAQRAELLALDLAKSLGIQ